MHRLPLSAVGPDGRAVVTLGDREVAVFLVDGAVHAFANACPHEGNPLALGEIAGPTLTCAFHGWRFDLDTGACLIGEAAATRYPAELRGEEILIEVED